MILETINPGVHKVRLKVREIIYGNDVIDKYTGWDKVNPITKVQKRFPQFT